MSLAKKIGLWLLLGAASLQSAKLLADEEGKDQGTDEDTLALIEAERVEQKREALEALADLDEHNMDENLIKAHRYIRRTGKSFRTVIASFSDPQKYYVVGFDPIPRLNEIGREDSFSFKFISFYLLHEASTPPH